MATPIKTSTVNSGVENINFQLQNTVTIMQGNFFTYFPNLKNFISQKLGMKFLPFFSENKNIIAISVSESTIEDVSNRAIDYKMVGNLTKLVTYFTWNNGEINEIELGAFKGTNNLNSLSVKNNKIHELKSCTFEGLENIATIYLSDNNVHQFSSSLRIHRFKKCSYPRFEQQSKYAVNANHSNEGN